MKPTASPTLLVLAAGMGSRYGGLKQIDRLVRAAKPSSIIRFMTRYAPASASSYSSFAKILSSSSKRLSARVLKSALPVEYVFQELNLLPPGFRSARGTHQAVGHRACDSDGRRRHSRALCRNQCRRFLWSRGLSRAGAAVAVRLTGLLNGGIYSSQHAFRIRIGGARRVPGKQ